jgi:hypothetical protein
MSALRTAPGPPGGRRLRTAVLVRLGSGQGMRAREPGDSEGEMTEGDLADLFSFLRGVRTHRLCSGGVEGAVAGGHCWLR